MKVRTDFVTNSSSSSFCVSLSGENIGLEITAEKYGGDYESNGLTVNNISISCGEEDFGSVGDWPDYLEDIQSCIGFEPFFLGDLLDLEDAESIREFILDKISVADQYILEEIDDCEDDEDEDVDLDVIKSMVTEIIGNGEKIVSSARKSLKSIKNTEDILTWSMTMDGGGRGEETQSFRELLDKIFNYRDCRAMTDILDNQEYGNEEKFTKLRALPFLEHMSDQGLMNIVEFEDEYEGASVKQYFDESGKVVFEIENTDGRF